MYKVKIELEGPSYTVSVTDTETGEFQTITRESRFVDPELHARSIADDLIMTMKNKKQISRTIEYEVE